MVMHANRGYAASSAWASNATASATIPMQLAYARLLAAKPRRRIGATLRDLCLLVFSWALLIGLFVYPVAHLVGLAACAIALVVLPAERNSNAVANVD
jgi:hypothetical protein